MEAWNINQAWCKGCSVCVAFCPKKALSLVKEKATVNRDLCILCGMCELYCPDLAITIDQERKKAEIKARKEAKS